MGGILADISIQGQVEILGHVWGSGYWEEVWVSLGWQVYTLADLELGPQTPDAVIWRVCQERQLLLITANRNHDGEDSLEATIRRENGPDSLPVFTIADAEHLRNSRDYAERVVQKLLEYFLEIEHYRGAGRLFVP